MGKRHKLKETPEEEVIELVNRGGQKAAADAYGVTQSSISLWLKKRGYVPVIRWMKSQEKAS